MPSFIARGATSPPPTTSWLGSPLADNRGFTMLRPGHYVQAQNRLQADSLGPANYINLWSPFNSFVTTGSGTNAPTITLGATTTAPDGTSSGNAQHITEAATNGFHVLLAYCPVGASARFGFYSMRLGVIAKAAERTRIMLTMSWNTSCALPIFPGNGCQTVFDLVGVQIGVPTTSYNNMGFPTGPDIIPRYTEIKPLGDGWCLCLMDVFVPAGQGSFGGIFASIMIDAGSGTEPAHVSYAGDGTSGFYGWRSSMLPPAAWVFSNAVDFHDDFDDINTIDIHNTKAPGYIWYTNNVWPQWPLGYLGDNAPTPLGQISVANSQLTLQQWNTHFYQSQMTTAVSINDTDPGFIGRAFTLPQMVDMKVKFDPVNFGADFCLLWNTDMAVIQEPVGFGLTGRIPGANWEYTGGASLDHGATGFHPYLPLATWDLPTVGSMGICLGYVLWDSTYSYSGNAGNYAIYNGQLYQCIYQVGGPPPDPCINKIPPDHLNDGYWRFVPPSEGWPITNPSSYDLFDFRDFNVYTMLVLPTPFNDAGWVLSFFNGAPCNGNPPAISSLPCNVCYSPQTPPDQATQTGYITRWNGAQYMLILFSGGGTGDPAVFDYITVSH